MSGDGEFTITGDVTSTITFDYYIYDASDGTRGTTEQITVLANTPITAGVGAYTLTGQDADTKESDSLAAEVGAYTLTGQDVSTLVGGAVTLTAEAGSYALTGADVTTIPTNILVADSSAYVLVGLDADVGVSVVIMAAGVGAYALVGHPVTLSVTVRHGIWTERSEQSKIWTERV
jgi:hypothetical protein